MRTISILILSAGALLAQTSNPTPEQIRQMEQNRAAMEQIRNQVEMQLQKLQAQAAGGVGNLEGQITLLQKKLTELRKANTESHPDVVATKADLARLQQELSALAQRQDAAKAEAEARLSRINAIADVCPTSSRFQADLREIQTEERILEKNLAEMLKQFTEPHPQVKVTKANLERIRAKEQEVKTQMAVTSALCVLTDAPKSQASNIAREDLARGPFSAIPLNPQDRWWRNNATAQSLSLSADQQKRMDDVLQQYRLKLVDVNGALQKEEIALEPLVGAEKLDEGKITAQIDRVAQARAELEKVNGRMLLQIRKQLTADQWRKLNK